MEPEIETQYSIVGPCRQTQTLLRITSGVMAEEEDAENDVQIEERDMCTSTTVIEAEDAADAIPTAVAVDNKAGMHVVVIAHLNKPTSPPRCQKRNRQTPRRLRLQSERLARSHPNRSTDQCNQQVRHMCRLVESRDSYLCLPQVYPCQSAIRYRPPHPRQRHHNRCRPRGRADDTKLYKERQPG